jgi:dihydrofolate reductase
MNIAIIAAMTKDRVIGKNGDIPWLIEDRSLYKKDLKRFRRITQGEVVIMGRKTYESIGFNLPKRINIVISSNPNFHPEGVIVVNSFQAAVNAAALFRDNLTSTALVIGGSRVYKDAIEVADFMFITEIKKDFDGDTFFPEFDREEWEEVEIDKHFIDFDNEFMRTINLKKIK